MWQVPGRGAGCPYAGQSADGGTPAAAAAARADAARPPAHSVGLPRLSGSGSHHLPRDIGRTGTDMCFVVAQTGYSVRNVNFNSESS